MVESDRNLDFGGNAVKGKRFSHSLLDMNDKDAIRTLGEIDLAAPQDSQTRLHKLRTLQDANDQLTAIMDQKHAAEALAHPQPGTNTKRKFVNVLYDLNKSPCDFERTSARKPFFE